MCLLDKANGWIHHNSPEILLTALSHKTRGVWSLLIETGSLKKAVNIALYPIAIRTSLSAGCQKHSAHRLTGKSKFYSFSNSGQGHFSLIAGTGSDPNFNVGHVCSWFAHVISQKQHSFYLGFCSVPNNSLHKLFQCYFSQMSFSSERKKWFNLKMIKLGYRKKPWLGNERERGPLEVILSPWFSRYQPWPVEISWGSSGGALTCSTWLQSPKDIMPVVNWHSTGPFCPPQARGGGGV